MTWWRCAIVSRRLWRLAALALLLAGCGEYRHERLSLVPVGQVSATELRFLRRDLAAFYGVRCAIRTERLAVPTGAAQVDADALLNALEALPTERGERLLAVCSGDGGQPGTSFVFGLARRRGRCGVIFTGRLRTDVDQRGYERRLAIEAHHELGHVYGLGHCPNDGCAMCFSPGLIDVDAKRPSYCEHCRELLERWRRER
ncbi:MAG: hypothetical protein HZB16_12310 [Armatimonadetes bacterium]|nr:hypothetical protein [Armatimonadota bacterium]